MDITSHHLVVLLGLNVARSFRLLQHPSLFAQYFIDIDLKIIFNDNVKLFVNVLCSIATFFNLF